MDVSPSCKTVIWSITIHIPCKKDSNRCESFLQNTDDTVSGKITVQKDSNRCESFLQNTDDTKSGQSPVQKGLKQVWVLFAKHRWYRVWSIYCAERTQMGVSHFCKTQIIQSLGNLLCKKDSNWCESFLQTWNMSFSVACNFQSLITFLILSIATCSLDHMMCFEIYYLHTKNAKMTKIWPEPFLRNTLEILLGIMNYAKCVLGWLHRAST